MRHYSVEDFHGKVDSLYRLVLLASRRANQISRTESRPLIAISSRKPTVIALEEVLDGKVTYTTGETDEVDYVE
jgi:DNA-directed RNA polymerase subunit omega